MSSAGIILSVSTWVALAALAIAFLLTVWRVVKGPTLPDRVVALDMLVGIVIGFIALIAIRTGFTLYIDIAIALGLVGFLATVAFARFILANKSHYDQGKAEGGAPPVERVRQASPVSPSAAVAGKDALKASSGKTAAVRPVETGDERSGKRAAGAAGRSGNTAKKAAATGTAKKAPAKRSALPHDAATPVVKPKRKAGGKVVGKAADKPEKGE